MAEVAIREGVRADFQPDNNGMDLRNCADKGMVDEAIHNDASNGKGQRGIYAVSPRYGSPRGFKGFGDLCTILGLHIVSFCAANGSFGLVSSC